MKKLLSVIAIVLLAFPAFSQDDFGGGFGGGFDGVLTGGDIDALFGGGGGNRGNRGNNNNIPDPAAMLVQMKDLLKLRKVPLSKDQEKTLKTFLETEIAAMRTDLEAQFSNRGNSNNNNRGNNQSNMIVEVFNVVTKHNAELLTAIKADLTPDQVSLITKAEKDKKTCSVMLDLINPQQIQNRGNDGGRGGRGNNNQNFPIEGFDGFDPRANRGGNNNNNNSFVQQFPDRAYCTSAASTTAERLAPIAQILTKGKKPLNADQEKKFSDLIEARVPVMQQELRDKDPQLANLINQINNQNRNNNNNNNNNNANTEVNPQTLRNNIVNTIMSQLGIPNNNNNNNRGRGNNNPPANNATPAANNATAATPATPGTPATAAAAANTANANTAANANNNNNNRGNRGNNFNPQAEIQKKNEELLDKVAAKLNPDQSAVVKKYKYDQIKAKGGVERYRGIMEQEGTPLTPEQTTQIQRLFDANNQAVRVYADQMVQAEMAKATTLEPPAPPANQNNQNQNRPNPNNVNQNPIAQQIVAKVMPEVSKRHALLDRGLTETIMRLFTPAQVASYKINSL